ncbi:hypothetical protein SAMN05216247_11954 [Pseudomonas salomonii]|uniref:Uncharacterized protein n=1 Tax=Pseudomonas salomonii TaxID=191391 RepID=A0A1H3V0T8_9PSED|nr:hypothetical protein [Pseudomonas sp. 58 R 3]SDZ67841.1 hypothetical protein SAMN05216247_11954 [Pseudomonas salomonii]
MNSVYVDGVYIGKAKNLKGVFVRGIDQGPVAIGGEL